MKKRWFVVILTIGLLLCVLPPSVLALSPDPTITDADGNILGWSDLSTVPYSLDDLQEQRLAVVDAKSGTAAAPGLWETGSGKSLADADSERLAVVDAKPGTVAAPGLSETGLENSLADEGSDEVAEELEDNDPAGDTDSPTTLDDGPADGTDSTPVCQIGEKTYTSLQSAINDAKDNEQIDLLKNIELDEGLTFKGRESHKKTLTISGGGTYTLTLNEKGIYAFQSNLTFQDLTLDIYANTNPEGSGGTANLISNSDLYLKRVRCTIRPVGNCGSGMFLYQETNLYLDDSEVTVEDVISATDINGKHIGGNGIYADNSEYDGLNRKVILNDSHLKATGCSHAGLMLDPIDMTLNSSEVEVADNGNYGFSLYHGELTMNASMLKATNNDKTGGKFGIYVGSLNMDGASTLEAYFNGGSGLGIGSPIGPEGPEDLKKSFIRGRVTCEYNGDLDTFRGGSGGGLYVYAGDHEDEITHVTTSYRGNVTIESGATVSLCNNAGLSGIQNSWILKIASGAHVSVDGNKNVGIYNSLDAQLTIEGGAYVSASGNGEHGIQNLPQGRLNRGKFVIEEGATVLVNDNTQFGIVNMPQNTFTVEKGVDLEVERNQNSGIYNFPGATLNLGSGTVRYNHAAFGGGLSNVGTAILSDDVQLYNNHAERFGDDIYNYNYAGCSLTFGPTGRGWELDGAPDCYDFITGWYDDRGSARWNAHAEDEDARHTDLVQPGTELTGPLSLKAAHGSLSTGSLTVRKETTGELLPSDYDTAFTFELTLDDNTITTMNDKWCGVPFKNGKASFTLKSGESITLSNLPAGIGYTITEAAQDNWTLMNINDAETGVVPQNDTAEVVFTNLKNSLDLPDVPILPILPIEPEEPEIPEEPEKPQTPDVPEEPKGPETPKESEEPEIPEEPEQPQTSEVPEEPEGPETPKETEETEVPAQNTTAETLIQTGTTDWLAAVLLISGFGLLVCGWFFNRKQRAAKH